MGTTSRNPNAASRGKSTAPGLILRLSDPPRFYIIASNSEEEAEVRPLVRLIGAVLAVLAKAAA